MKLGDLQVAYLGVEVPDTVALGGFLADVVGMVPGDDPGTWRNDRKTLKRTRSASRCSLAGG